ncbi:MAG: type II secretion system F family protein [Patescibacteria group bacterium]|jgi:type IV pilus assembly protein PilC
MPKFLYKARNNKGEVVTGTVIAPNHPEAEAVLIKNNLIPVDIVSGKQEGLFKLLFNKVSVKDRAIISRQLSTMLAAGLPLSKAISILIKQAKNETIKNIFLDIYKDLEQGYSFSIALSKHPEAFDRVFVSVVGSGESTGKLDSVLNELANQLERDSSFNSKVKGALAYPGFIFAMVIVAGFFMLTVVIPKLKTMFDSAGKELPIITRMLLYASDFMQKWWWLVALLIVGLILLIKVWGGSPKGSRFFSKLQMSIPGLKTVMESMHMYRFTRIMSMLISSGVPLLDALKIGSAVMDNPIYESALTNVASQVEKGVPFSVQLLKEPVFPQLIGNMVAVGEETGELDKVLNKVADYYEEATNESVKTISSLVEPAILVLVGIAVAFMVFAIYVPIYQINTSVGG